MKYKVGQAVTHETKGKGSIIEIDEKNCTYFVIFKEGNMWCNEKRLRSITTLSTAEMIAALAENPEQRYKSVGAELYELEAYLSNKGYVLFKSPSGRDQAFDGNIRPIDQWTLVPPKPQPVPFLEAVKAYSEGKTIACKMKDKFGGACKYTYTPEQWCDFGFVLKASEACPISSGEILTGIWTVED